MTTSRSPALRRARGLHAVLAAAAVALAVLDGLLLSGAVPLRAQATAVGCGRSGTDAVRSASSLVWLPLTGGSGTPLVTGGPGQLSHPAVSPDGRSIAFLAHGNGILAQLEICNLRRHTTTPVPMPFPASNFTPSWDGKGRSLVFLGGDLQGWGADQRPFVVEPNGSRLRQLGGNAPWYYDGVAVSPDGTKLALLLAWKDPNGGEPEQLAVLDLRTRRLTRVAGSAQVAQIDAMSWSPDGRRIVFDGYRDNEHGGLYVVDVATKKVTPLLLRGAGAVAPAWSPDGRSVAFVRRSRRSSSIWLLDLRTGAQRRLTHGGVDVAPAWAPNGRALIFVRR